MTEEVEATPAAEAAAEEHGVDLTQVEGSGAEGRVTKADVVEAAQSGDDVQAVQERTQAAVENAGQPIPESDAPGYNDEATHHSPNSEPDGSDQARRVHPDIGGYQYQGDDSDAQFVESAENVDK